MELAEAIKKAHEEIGGLSGIYKDLHEITKMAEDTLKDAQWSRATEIRDRALSAKNKLDIFTTELVDWMNQQKKETNKKETI